jgi:hypothetical protein
MGTSARARAEINRAIASASRSVDAFCARPPESFAPVLATRTFDWPDAAQARAGRLWLDDQPLASASRIESADVEIVAADYFLRPDNGPPFGYIEIDRASAAAFAGGLTAQRSIEITGIWLAAPPENAAAGALAEALDATETEVQVSATGAALVDVGSILLCESERMIVTERAMLDTTVNTGSALAESVASRSLTVADGTAFVAGELLLIESERVLVNDIAGNVLILERAIDGTALAAHDAGVDVYASRSLTVTRGALGTTAATHADTTALTVHVPAASVAELTEAYALTALSNRSSGYAQTPGAGENSRRPTGTSIPELERRVWDAYGNKVRHRAV